MRLYEMTDDAEVIENTLSNDPNLDDIVVSEFKKKYPTVPISISSGILTTGTDIGHSGTDFYLQYFPSVEDGYAGVYIVEAFSGKYKGVILSILQELLKYIGARTPNYEPALFIESDESRGAWDHISKKLNVLLIVVE